MIPSERYFGHLFGFFLDNRASLFDLSKMLAWCTAIILVFVAENVPSENYGFASWYVDVKSGL